MSRLRRGPIHSSAFRILARLACVAALSMAGGCASFDPVTAGRESDRSTVRECVEWYRSLDAAIDAAGVRDAQDARVRGFPYMRVDRFTASLRESARAQDSMMLALAERLVELDVEARKHEIANLPPERLKAIWRGAGEAAVATSLEQTRECALRLLAFDLDSSKAGEAMLGRLSVPDEYVSAYRILGLYEVSQIPFTIGVRRQLAQTEAAFARDLDATAQGTLVRYSPPARPRIGRERVREILERAIENPLKVPTPVGEELDALFALYAPSFEIETAGDFDRPGALRWRWGAIPEVDAADPAVYRQVSHTRYQGRNLLQLVYTIWFSERPAESPQDLLSGALDGVVFRVTLAPDGTPLLYDTMHPCGCYHMFFPTPRAVPRPAPEGEPEWAFVPQKLRAIDPADRLVVRIAARTHYVERVYRDQDDSLARYELRPYDELRSLRRMPGDTRSVFGPDGIVAGTQRGERFLFWPMGIESAGAMRQWGRHATAFVGRRHFDDADLLERRFVLDLR